MIKFTLSALVLVTLGACQSLPPASMSRAHPADNGGAIGEAAGIESIDARTRLFIDRALANLGQPYRYGGAAPGGFDCSGLIFYAAAAAGISLPRTAREQLASGVPINREELRAGDLIFMHLSKKQLHVGLVVDQERFIHAPSTGSQVRIDSLSALPYSMKFFTARRIIGAHAVKVQ